MTKIFTFITMLLAPLSAFAQHNHAADRPEKLPVEIGQSTFSAIAEIVAMLNNDPQTDWSTVNIDALHRHLIDMDNVMTQSQVLMMSDNEIVTFIITGKGEIIASIQRIVNAHAKMLSGATGWSVDVKNQADGVTMSVAGEDKDTDMIMGLGFYGLLTVGAHHQPHHMMIARGLDPH